MIFAKTILFTAAMAMTAASVTASPIINRRDPQATDTIISEVDVYVGVDTSLDDISVGVDAGLDDMPAAQAILGPTVTRSGNNYTWEFTNLNVRDTGPFGITADSWGTRLPNVNRVWTSDPLDPKNYVMRINYPNGTTTPSAASNPPNVVGGVGFYAQPISPGILKTANLVEFEYSVYFPPGYNFVRGGKLPGLYGGDGTKKGCSGGNDGDSCFSLRYMWRKLGAGETYIYRPKSAIMDPSYCKIRPYSFCDADYGDSIGRGSFTFTPGKWTNLRQQIGLNIPGTQTGTMKVWADDKLVIDFSKMVWRTSPNVTVQGIVFQSFFGGSTADWATPVDQYTLFKGFKMSAFC